MYYVQGENTTLVDTTATTVSIDLLLAFLSVSTFFIISFTLSPPFFYLSISNYASIL
jgi:hypothetical protein